MLRKKTHLCFLLFFAVFFSLADASSFVVAKTTPAYQAPSTETVVIASLEEGTLVEVTHQAGNFWRVEMSEGKVGFVSGTTLKPAQLKGGVLAPLAIAAASPLGKIIVTRVMDWVEKKLDPSKEGEAKAGETVPVGRELTVIERQDGEWLRVRDGSGRVGYIKDGPQVVILQEVSNADPRMTGIWKNAGPIPATAAGLTLQIEVHKIDGTPVPPGDTLRRGDEYRIYVTAGADCWVRITCETPDFNHVCQYYPNRFPGAQTSMKLKAGQTYSSEFLPSGVNFFIADPIGGKDILRIEATTASPFHYVSSGDACATAESFKGGGFSVAGTVVNPTAQVIIEFPIQTKP
jgi:hypothetical protein